MPEPGEQEQQEQLITHDGPSVEDGRPREVTVTQDSERERTSEEGQIARSASNGVASGDVIIPSLTHRGEDDHALLSKETLLPVSGMVRLSRRELDVIDHPAFQRLFEIHQLGQANLVYRGATHMRGEHAIGTLEEATRLAEATRRNASPDTPLISEHWQPAEPLSDVEVAFVRLAALLHDVGHLAAGHTLEDELGLLSHHDGDERIEMVLDRVEWHGRTYPPLRQLVDENYMREAQQAGQLNEDGESLSASELLVWLISRDHKDAQSTSGSGFRVGVCRDLVGNTICADLLDYLHRDFLHLGKPRLFDPRLLEYLEIRTRQVGGARQDRLAINLRGAPRPRPDAVTAILELLESRYQLAEIALFHRVKNAASGMLERAIAEYRDTFADTERLDAVAGLTPRLLECSDLEMLSLFESELDARRNTRNRMRVDGAIDLLRRLRVRQLHRDVHILYQDEVGGPQAARVIVERFCEDPDLHGADAIIEIQQAADRRLAALRTLEQDFDLSPGDLVMYCPSLQMNTKLAQVGIYFNGVVDSLANLDRENGNLTGGHLAAQQQRFRRLWRISFSIDRNAYDRLDEVGLLDCLRETIERVVLWRPSWEEKPVEDVVRTIAEDLVKLERSPWYGREIVEPAMNRQQSSVAYAGGAPSVRSFIGEMPKARRSSRKP
jgi:HD superfamily phosphohydrolase